MTAGRAQALRVTALTLLLVLGTMALAQAVWLEAGLGYREVASGRYEGGLGFGLRGTYPLTDVAGLYGAVGLRHGPTVDAGGWFSFRPGPQDPFGLRSYLGAGLGYSGGDLGLALTGALSYEVARGIALTVAYTHRPILLPRLSQRFDISAGVRLELGSLGFD